MVVSEPKRYALRLELVLSERPTSITPPAMPP
jgi:hypothetical protein